MVYEGNEKYVFISYCHQDSAIVLPILQKMAEAGIRLWYDSGIEAGTEWPEYIEERLVNAERVLVFMTPSAVDSRNCRNEINFALELKKELLVVYLEDTVLLKGMRLQLNSSQSLFRKNHSSQDSFLKELIGARILQPCRDAVVTPVAAAPVQGESAPAAETKSVTTWLPNLLLVMTAVFAAVVLAILAWPMLFDSGEPQVTEPSQSMTEPLQMSNELMDFTVQLEGVVYQLPCRYEELKEQGWVISYGATEESILRGNSSHPFQMSRNGKTIGVTVYNLSGNAATIKNSLVGGFDVEKSSGVELVLAQNVSLQMSMQEILDTLGTPSYRNDTENYCHFYYQGEESISTVQFFMYTAEGKEDRSSIHIENMIDTGEFKTETNPEKPLFLLSYQAPEELEATAASSVVRIGGDLYRLPAPVSSFQENGWVIVQQPSYVCAGNTDSIRLERDGAKLTLSVVNSSAYQTLPENCAVYKCNIKASDGIACELSGGVRLGEIVPTEAVEAFSMYAGGSKNTLDYSDEKAQLKISIDLNPQTNEVTDICVQCDLWND